MKTIAIFTSGHSRGSNFLAIYNYIKEHKLPIQIEYLFATDPTAPVIEIASELGVPVFEVAGGRWQVAETPPLPPSRDRIYSVSTQLIAICRDHPTDLIVLCGFMRKLSTDFLHTIKTPVINIHPALLPKYGGKGMYGMNVHKAVWEAGEKVSGATVHYVNEYYDAGDIIVQESCDISDCHTPEEIATKVLKIEHQIYPKTIAKLLL